MANKATIGSLVVQVRSRADQLLSPTFDDDAEVKVWVRDSLAQLYEQLVSQWQDWGIQIVPMSLIANQTVYALPPDFRAAQALYALYSNGTVRFPLKRYNTAEPSFAPNYSPFTSTPISYRVENNVLRIQNPPSVTIPNCLELHYTATYQGPLLDFTSIDLNLPRGWEEWIILDVMQKMRLRMRLDADYIIAQKRDVESRIMRAAFRRDQTVSDVTDAYKTYTFFPQQLSGPTYWVS